MREYMTEKEIDDLVKEIMDLPRVESNHPVSTLYGFDVDTLINTLRDFKRLPTYDEVLKQNQKYKVVIDRARVLVNNVYNSLENADKPIKFYEEILDILNINERNWTDLNGKEWNKWVTQKQLQ